MEKLKKMGALVPAMGVAVLTGLSQVTISGARVGLEASDVSSISSSIGEGFSGMLSNTVMLVGVIALVSFAWITIRFIGKKARGK